MAYAPTKWNLGELYPSFASPELQSAFDNVEEQVMSFEGVRGKLNPDIDPNRLITGQQLTIPSKNEMLPLPIVLVGLGLAWIPFMKYVSPQLYIYLQSVQAYIAPPIAACFLLGILSKRLNGRGALAALWTGFVLGFARLVLELSKARLAPGSFWAWYAGINFLHFAALLFLLCSLILIVVSAVTPPPAAERVADLTMQTAAPVADPADSPRERRIAVVFSILLAATIGSLWFVFR